MTGYSDEYARGYDDATQGAAPDYGQATTEDLMHYIAGRRAGRQDAPHRCPHADGMIDLTDRDVRELARQEHRSQLYTIKGSRFILIRCGCPDAPPIDEVGYTRLDWPTALQMVGAEQEGD